MSTLLDSVEQNIPIMAESSIGQCCREARLEARWSASRVHTQNCTELSYFPPSSNNQGTGTKNLCVDVNLKDKGKTHD